MLRGKMKTQIVLTLLLATTALGQSLPDSIPPWADLGVNGIYLATPSKVSATFGNLMGSLIESEEDFPYVNCSNKTGTQILKLIFHPGSRRNVFHEFEVGPQRIKFDEKAIVINSIDEFSTYKGIKLGSSFEEVTDIFGEGYQILDKGNEILYLHDVLGDENTEFLDHFNMPIYYARYHFEKDRLIWFRFGFDYP